MARPKTMASINAKIRKEQESVEKTKARYDATVTELEALLSEKKELQFKELIVAIEKSYEDVLQFVKDGRC